MFMTLLYINPWRWEVVYTKSFVSTLIVIVLKGCIHKVCCVQLTRLNSCYITQGWNKLGGVPVPETTLVSGYWEGEGIVPPFRINVIVIFWWINLLKS